MSFTSSVPFTSNITRKEFSSKEIESIILVLEKQRPKSCREYYYTRNYTVKQENDQNKILITKKDGARIVSREHMDAFISLAHARTIHGGIRKTFAEAKKNVANVKLAQVKKFVSEKCPKCINRLKFRKLKDRRVKVTSPIVSDGFCQRAQIDLIDVRSYGLIFRTFEPCKYIFNYQDNLTRFCLLKAIPDKTATTIINCLIQCFCVLGAPSYLHSDNGGEFRNYQLTSYLSQYWPDVKLIKGKPYHPRSQGAIERANKDIKEKIVNLITEKERQDGGLDAEQTLAYIQLLKNSSYNRTIKCSPYRALFGQDPIIDLMVEKIGSTCRVLGPPPAESEKDEHLKSESEKDGEFENNTVNETDRDSLLSERENTLKICREKANESTKKAADKMLQ